MPGQTFIYLEQGFRYQSVEVIQALKARARKPLRKSGRIWAKTPSREDFPSCLGRPRAAQTRITFVRGRLLAREREERTGTRRLRDIESVHPDRTLDAHVAREHQRSLPDLRA